MIKNPIVDSQESPNFQPGNWETVVGTSLGCLPRNDTEKERGRWKEIRRIAKRIGSLPVKQTFKVTIASYVEQPGEPSSMAAVTMEIP